MVGGIRYAAILGQVYLFGDRGYLHHIGKLELEFRRNVIKFGTLMKYQRFLRLVTTYIRYPTHAG